ncbi:MAG: PAS domain-containing protein, partial [Planctomycetota bacterium]
MGETGGQSTARLVEELTGARARITELEGRVRESEQRPRDLAELLPLAVFETDLRGMLTYVNRFGMEWMGYTQRDVDEGFDVFRVFEPEDLRRARENFSKVLSGTSVSGHEYRARKRDGTPLSIQVHSSPIVRYGETVGLRGVLYDVTERRWAEESVRM